MTYRAHTLIVLVTSIALWVAPQSVRSAEPLTIHSYSANEGGFLSNSHIVANDTEAVIIDAQLSVPEGLNVGRMIKSGGHSLSKIIITHPHPDHYYGIQALGTLFPDARILASRLTTSALDSAIAHWIENPASADDFAQTSVLENGGFNLGQTPIIYRTFRSGESAENTVLYIPDQHILFVGDLASNGVHMWLAEGNLDNWLAQLDVIRSLGPIHSIYPGHGPVGGPSLLDDAEAYIENFKIAIDSSASQAEAIEFMTNHYPDYQLPQILHGSVRAIMSAN